jgi:dTDP-4-amino-4,6-dideoxygalactose transaminase
LPHLPAYIAARQRAAQAYDTALQSLPWLETPKCLPASTHVYHQYTLKIKDGRRDGLRQYLHAQGIPTMVYYPLSLQEQPAFQHIARQGCDAPVSEKLGRSVLSLPMHTELSDEQIHQITQEIINYGQQ